MNLIRAAVELRNAAWESSVESGLAIDVSTAWPTQGWTAESISCPTAGMTMEEAIAGAQEAGVQSRIVITSLRLDPDWVVPFGLPGAGSHADGRTYVADQTNIFGGKVTPSGSHWTVGSDGRVWWYPTNCSNQSTA